MPVAIVELDAAIRNASHTETFALLRGVSETERSELVRPLKALSTDIWRSLPDYAKYSNALTLADMALSLVDENTSATHRIIKSAAWMFDGYADALVDRNPPWLAGMTEEFLATKLPSDLLEDNNYSAGEALRSRLGMPRPKTHRYAVATVFALTRGKSGRSPEFDSRMEPTLEIYRADAELREQLLLAIESTGLVRVTKHWMDTKEESKTRGYPAVVKALTAQGLMSRELVIAAVITGLQDDGANAASVSLHRLFLEVLEVTPGEVLAAHREAVERLSKSTQKNVRKWAVDTLAAGSSQVPAKRVESSDDPRHSGTPR